MSNNDFNPGILTAKTKIFNFFRVHSGLKFYKKQINALYIQQKTDRNYDCVREDTMPKIIAIHIRNINETFIGIFILH